MKALQVTRNGSPGEVLAAVEVEVPEPGPDEVRIRVGAVVHRALRPVAIEYFEAKAARRVTMARRISEARRERARRTRLDSAEEQERADRGNGAASQAFASSIVRARKDSRSGVPNRGSPPRRKPSNW